MNLDKLVRNNVKKMIAYSSARNMHLSGILLDANENPFDTNEAGYNRYPDPNHSELRNALAKYHGVSPENIFAGSGSDEIIDLIYRIFCVPGKDNVIIPEPTYGMYYVAAELNDVNIFTCELNENFQPEPEVILNLVDDNTKIIFLCSPNNPTGNLINSERINAVVENFDGIVLLDEAYAEFAEYDSPPTFKFNSSNLIRMRTFSKAWGLAGLRTGYCVADSEIVKLLYRVKPPYNLNGHSQKMAANMVEKKSSDMLEKVGIILHERERMIRFLQKRKGIEKVFESNANFVLFRTRKSSDLFNYLKQNGVIIRDRSSQVNLENCLRITIGTPPENEIAMKLIEKFYE